MEVQAPQRCTEEALSRVGEESPGSLVSIFGHHSGRGLGSLLKPHQGGNLDSPISLPGVGILTGFLWCLAGVIFCLAGLLPLLGFLVFRLPVSLVPCLGYIRQKKRKPRELTPCCSLDSEISSLCAFFSPPCGVFPCVFYEYCAGFSVVLSGRTRERYIYPTFPVWKSLHITLLLIITVPADRYLRGYCED